MKLKIIEMYWNYGVLSIWRKSEKRNETLIGINEDVLQFIDVLLYDVSSLFKNNDKDLVNFVAWSCLLTKI